MGFGTKAVKQISFEETQIVEVTFCLEKKKKIISNGVIGLFNFVVRLALVGVGGLKNGLG